MDKFTSEIIKHIAVISESESGWKKELNLVSWNGQEPKLDIRSWNQDHSCCSKGTTLTTEEFEALQNIELQSEV